MDLQPYYCKTCGKMLCKGILTSKDNILEVKCRGCKNLSTFTGEDAVVIKKRNELIIHGLIPDPEKNEV